jgi:hypothetical protein
MLPRTTLTDHPDIAQNIGYVMAEYANLELLLFVIYAAYLTSPTSELYYDFFSVRSINSRCEMIENSWQEQEISAVERKSLAYLLNRFKSAAKRRTEIAHVVFLSDGTPTRIRFLKRKCLREPLDQALFDRTFTQYQDLGTDLVVFASYAIKPPSRAPQILNELPFPPPRNTRGGALSIQRPPERLTTTEIDQSLSRLKLPTP